MPKKKTPAATPDLFDFSAPQSDESEKATEMAPEKAPETATPEKAPESDATVGAPEATTSDVEAAAPEEAQTADDVAADAEEEAGAVAQGPASASDDAASGSEQLDDAGLPAVLSDGGAVQNDGMLTLARYAAHAYLEYALSVVKSRALPDVFDGMKPVQRRILYAMDRMRLAPPAKAVKCARVVGDVLGKYHPHGDQAAYEAMVRMAQDFSLRYPLVDGEGNFGSRDGDGPAAMRYTEARLTKISELLLSELDSGDVDFIPNYDGAFKEPTHLPARLPFVLLNGASGIAVGMATEIPSHNLREVAEAVLLLLKNPEASLDDVLAVMPGPDYPGGGQIITSCADIRQLYRTGRGSLRVRARYHFEELQRGLWQLVVDELPPAANAELVLSQIEELTNPKPKAGKKSLTADQQADKTLMLSMLEGVRNECDKDTPMRLVFEPRSSRIEREAFVSLLLSKTSLECNAPMNLVMIGTDGRPRQKGLLEILSEWLEARKETVRRRTRTRLEKVELRLHILEGRSIAVDNIDRVIEIVRFEEDPKACLMKEFHLTAAQAEDILELRLRQLANLEVERVLSEMKNLREEAAELNRILADEKVLKNLIARETREAARTYGDDRRTLIEEAERAALEVTVAAEPVTVVISRQGFVRSRLGHGHDATLMSFKRGDGLLAAYECSSDDTLIVVGGNGRVYSVAVDQLPSARGDGKPITSFIDFEVGSGIAGYLVGADSQSVVLANTQGLGLACTIKNLKARVRAGKTFMLLDEGASMLAPVMVHEGETRLACLSAEGRVLVFALDELRRLADGGKGVRLMDLNPGETLTSVVPVTDEGLVVRGTRGSSAKAKTIVRGEFERLNAHRARKGKEPEVRFVVEAIEAIAKPAAEPAGNQPATPSTSAPTAAAVEEDDEPDLLG